MRRLLDPGQPPGAVISALTPLQDLISSGNFGLLHFACHNTYDPVDGSSIRLDNVQFTPTLMTTAAIKKVLRPLRRPCSSTPAAAPDSTATYNRLDGWASKFLEAGAGRVHRIAVGGIRRGRPRIRPGTLPPASGTDPRSGKP